MKSTRIVNKIVKKETESFRQYLKDIAAIPVFTPEEEVQCYEKFSNGDLKAKEELIRRNLRFVVSIAKQFETPTILLEDLVNEGNVGLVLAADRYDVSTGFKFITYAVFWIKKIIFEYISNTSKMIRIPCNKVSSLSKYNNKTNELEQKHGRSVSSSEVLEELGEVLPSKEIKNFEKFLNLKVDSLDKTFSQGDIEITLQDMIIDDSLNSPDFTLNQADIKYELNALLDVLKDKDKQIMISLYGLNGVVQMTLDQVSEQVGLTRERVRQIRENSLKLLKKELFK